MIACASLPLYVGRAGGEKININPLWISHREKFRSIRFYTVGRRSDKTCSRGPNCNNADNACRIRYAWTPTSSTFDCATLYLTSVRSKTRDTSGQRKLRNYGVVQISESRPVPEAVHMYLFFSRADNGKGSSSDATRCYPPRSKLCSRSLKRPE